MRSVGNSLFPLFLTLAGVKHGGLLSPALFAIYIVLLSRPRACGYCCKLMNEFFGCLLCANDIVLMANTISSMHAMLHDCDFFAEEYYLKFNSVKSVAMSIGPGFNVTCAPLTLDGICTGT